MTNSARRRQVYSTSTVVWVVVVLLAVIATALVMVIGLDPPVAHAQASAADRDGVFVVAGKVTPETYGLYLVDTGKRRIAVYQWLPNSRKLRLMAVRNYTYDLRLDEYNTEKLPREIKKLVEESKPLDGKRPRP